MTRKLRLADFTFDPAARQLLRGDDEVHLSPKAFDLLQILVAERPRAVSKQELHERLWPDTFVSEVNLASLIAEIREALGDSAREPTFVRTVRRFGYALCGSATEGTPPPSCTSSFCWLVKDGRRLALHDGENVIGRDLEDGIRVDSPTVSRRHARILISPDGAILEDLESKNGTSVGDKAASRPIQLTDGDEIRVGSVVMRFRMTSAKGPTVTWSGVTRD